MSAPHGCLMATKLAGIFSAPAGWPPEQPLPCETMRAVRAPLRARATRAHGTRACDFTTTARRCGHAS